jgi:hypothetical protein
VIWHDERLPEARARFRIGPKSSRTLHHKSKEGQQ